MSTGCAYFSGDMGVMLKRQDALEAKVDKLSKEVRALRRSPGAKINNTQAELDERLKTVERDISYLRQANSRSAEALYALALSYYNEGAYEDAILEFQKFINSFPRNPRIPDAYLKQGLSLVHIRRADEAKFFFKTLIDKFPRSEEAKIAKKKLKESSAGS